MAEKTGKVYIKWVRSGIGFPRQQKDRVKSLGLRRLNQVIERPDTAHIRGLVASVPHLVELVERPASAEWTRLPEYKIVEARPQTVAPAERSEKSAPVEAPATSAESEPAAASSEKGPAEEGDRAVASPKRARVSKGRAAEPAEEASSGTEKGKRRRKAAAPKPTSEE